MKDGHTQDSGPVTFLSKRSIDIQTVFWLTGKSDNSAGELLLAGIYTVQTWRVKKERIEKEKQRELDDESRQLTLPVALDSAKVYNPQDAG